MARTKVALQLHTLSCGEETEHGSEPYLWPILIAAEADAPVVRVPTEQWAARVLVDQLQAGQSVAIPPEMSLDLVHVFDDKAAGLLVLIVALFEKDASPRHGSVAVLRYIEARARAFVQDHMAECRQSNGDRGDLRNQLAAGLNLGAAENAALAWWEKLITLASSGGFDDSVGFTVWTLSGQALAPRSISFDLSSSTEKYTLTGTLQVSVVLPDRCQTQRDAVAQAVAKVKGLQSIRAALQTQLHHATPQQKPAIVAEIARIAQVDLPAAEAVLAQAEAALQSCLSAFGGHGPLDNPPIG